MSGATYDALSLARWSGPSGRRVAQHDETLHACFVCCCKRASQIRIRGSHLQGLKPQSQGQRGSLRLFEFEDFGRSRRIPEHGHARKVRDHLLEQPQPFSDEIGREDSQSGDVSSWARKASDKTGSDWITTDHDDGNRGCCFFGRLCCQSTDRNDHINLETDQLSSKLWKPITFAFSVPVLDDDVLTFRMISVWAGDRFGNVDQVSVRDRVR